MRLFSPTQIAADAAAAVSIAEINQFSAVLTTVAVAVIRILIEIRIWKRQKKKENERTN